MNVDEIFSKYLKHPRSAIEQLAQLDLLGNFPSVTPREKWEPEVNQTLETLRALSINVLTAVAHVEQY